VPSPAQFDHLITVVPQGKDYLWLDTTPEVAPYAMLMYNLRGKKALVIPPTADPLLAETPADPPFPAQDQLVMRGALDTEGTYKAHGELTLRSDSEVLYRAIFHGSARAKWQDVLQAISYRLGFGGEVSNIQVDDPESTRNAFHISWDYTRKKYGDWENRQISPPTGTIPINVISEDKKPTGPIQVGFEGTTIYTAEIKLPDGYTLDPPANVDLKTPFAEYHATYSFSGGRYVTERRLTILKKEVSSAQWKDYVAFQKELTGDFSRFSAINSPGNTTLAAGKDDNPDAAAWIQKATESFEQRETTLAEDQLEKARKINPHQTNLNAMYGSLYLMQGKVDDAVAAIQLELKEHPENLRVARWFGELLVKMGRNDDAIAIYRTMLVSIPDDVDGNSDLAKLLVAKADWKEAQPVLERTIRLRPDNAQIQTWYGEACLKNGKTAEGLRALRSAAESSTNPAELAAIAGSLADAGQSLEVAEKAARQAVSIVEQKSGDLKLDQITTAQLKEMTDLADGWNALGWTIAQAGNLARSTSLPRGISLKTRSPAITLRRFMKNRASSPKHSKPLNWLKRVPILL
jgi:tetratricopeptide (TPR) repeat protein